MAAAGSGQKSEIAGVASVSLKELSAEHLASQARDGCKASFAELVARYHASLTRFLRRKTALQEDAEDLVQETFVKAYLNLHLYDDSWKFSTWLFTIARRLAISHYRSASKADNAQAPEVSGPAEPHAILSEKDAKESLWKIAEDRLTDVQYQALWLRYAEAMSVKEIAKALGKSTVNVKVLLYRARAALAGHLRKCPQSAEILELTPKKRSHKIPKLEGV